MIKAVIFDLWETLGSKNVGISESLQEKFGIAKTPAFMDLYENAVQLEKWGSEEAMAMNFLKEFKIEQTEENTQYVVDLFNQGIEKARQEERGQAHDLRVLRLHHGYDHWRGGRLQSG